MSPGRPILEPGTCHADAGVMVSESEGVWYKEESGDPARRVRAGRSVSQLGKCCGQLPRFSYIEEGTLAGSPGGGGHAWPAPGSPELHMAPTQPPTQRDPSSAAQAAWCLFAHENSRVSSLRCN